MITVTLTFDSMEALTEFTNSRTATAGAVVTTADAACVSGVDKPAPKTRAKKAEKPAEAKPEAAPAVAAPVAAAPAVAAVEAAPTIDDLRKLAVELVNKGFTEQLVALGKRHGLARLTEAPPELYGQLIAELTALQSV